MEFRSTVIAAFQQLQQRRVGRLTQQLEELSESTASETKSTVGDKYETSRALLQQQQDQVRQQLQELLEQRAALNNIAFTDPHDTVQMGSLVHTNRGWFLICAALGRVEVNSISVMAISPASPLGKSLFQKTSGSSVTVLEQSYSITALY